MALIRSILYMLWLVVTVVPYTLAVLLVRAFGGGPRGAYRPARAWLALAADSARPLLGIRRRVSGLENLPTDPAQGAVILVKHQSAYETFMMPAILPRRVAYVFKRELLHIPFFGWSMACMDMIHIDRGSPTRAFVRVIKQGRRLLDQGIWVVMFPEGTRTPRGQAGKYMVSGARLAIEAGVPVVPVAVTSGRVWPKSGFVKRPGVVEVSIGQPIASSGRKADELMAEVQTWIEAEMRRLDPEAYAPAAAPAQTPAGP
ncbi:1-acyl-sn-glycerol-3-phosphate acyltransferase [Comamonas sp. NLF-1-9]|uniref:lysophospholipid acyltransferase family protein n=1 Tax=Comamonas sp. NLF-1-9 TaxID=2853163 RepID=UPI001C487819|nr:lysophospholipid acyltransferase family protein [Comamonas sp. NLF-1-9]QXL83568.1 1-acyl-sn-glycerol-3-phosphate acyltransferase [Comamonas sp. NLF-1-9]